MVTPRMVAMVAQLSRPDAAILLRKCKNIVSCKSGVSPEGISTFLFRTWRLWNLSYSSLLVFKQILGKRVERGWGAPVIQVPAWPQLWSSVIAIVYRCRPAIPSYQVRSNQPGSGELISLSVCYRYYLHDLWDYPVPEHWAHECGRVQYDPRP